MHARPTSAGGIQFDVGAALSRHQVQVLITLASQPAEQPSSRRLLHRALWPAQQGPLTPAQRAALSRTIARLERWSMVRRPSSTTAQITPEGQSLARWIEGWGSWASYREQWLNNTGRD